MDGAASLFCCLGCVRVELKSIGVDLVCLIGDANGIFIPAVVSSRALVPRLSAIGSSMLCFLLTGNIAFTWITAADV